MSNTTTPKKTAKYYREILASGNISKSLEVLPEVIKKFGYKRWGDKYSKQNDTINLRGYTEFNWNHRIEGFFIGNYKESKGKLLVDIYWQGDSTDGTTSEYAKDLAYGKVIPAEHEWLGDRTYTRHSDLRISKEEFADAIKALAKFLDPAEIKARKIAQQRYEVKTKVFNYVDAKIGPYRKDEAFWNGRMGVQKVLEAKPELLDKTFEDLKPIVDKVFDNNNRSDYSLRGGYWSGEKKYNLAY